MLVEPEIAVRAVAARSLPRSYRETYQEGEESQRLELWRCEPGQYAERGVVNPISLYFSLRDSQDERVQKELKNMLSEIGLGVEDE